MKERIIQEINRTEKRIMELDCGRSYAEYDYMRGRRDGLRYALELIEKHEADEMLLNSDWGEMEVQE